MRLRQIAVRTAAAAVLVTTLAGCTVIAGAIPNGGPIAQSLAEDYARMSSGMSVAPVAVVSSRLSTYGNEHPGGTAAKPEAQVWAVVVSGAFPVASCFLQIQVPVYVYGATPAPIAKPCPPPAAHERVLIDAASGTTLEVMPGG